MNRPSTAIVSIRPETVRVKSKLNINPELESYHIESEIQQSEGLEMQSNVSAGKRLKVPESMRKFLKDRKLVRQIKPSSDSKELKINHSQNIKLNQSNVILNDSQINCTQGTIKTELNLHKSKQSQLGKDKNVLEIIRFPKTTKKMAICSICEGQITEQNEVRTFSCRHVFCLECIKSYVKYKINLYEKVSCPQQDCLQQLDTQTAFFKALSKRQRKNYKKIHNFYVTQGNPFKKLCSNDDCQGIIDIGQNQSILNCPDCKTTYCPKCFLKWHEGQCRDYEIKFIEDTLHYRQCVKCRIIVERTEGCNHITCKCGYQFCYICGDSWKHDHLCKVEDQQDHGCDWGQSWQDHFVFLIKLPLKFCLTLIFTSLWFGISFAAAPYNIFFFLYWIILILAGGPWTYIFQNEERPYWQKFLLFLIFPLLIIYCIPHGIRLFLQRFREECPFISEGYRFIIRI